MHLRAQSGDTYLKGLGILAMRVLRHQRGVYAGKSEEGLSQIAFWRM